MKRILVITCLFFTSVLCTQAQDINKADLAKQRADRLSDQMIRELQLNNFQANRLRTINREKVDKMITIEQKYASDPVLVDKNCQGVCRERDKELESFLSFDQYSKYYGSRSEFYQYDKDFAAKIGLTKPSKQNNELNKIISAKNPGEGTSSNPVLKPAVN